MAQVQYQRSGGLTAEVQCQPEQQHWFSTGITEDIATIRFRSAVAKYIRYQLHPIIIYQYCTGRVAFDLANRAASDDEPGGLAALSGAAAVIHGSTPTDAPNHNCSTG